MTNEREIITTSSSEKETTQGLSQNATKFMEALQGQGIDVAAALQELAMVNLAPNDSSEQGVTDNLVRPRFPFDQKRPDHTLVARQNYNLALKKRVDLPGDGDGDPTTSAINKGRWEYPEYMLSALYFNPGSDSPTTRTFHVSSTTVNNIKRDFPLPKDPLIFARKLDDDIARMLGTQQAKGVKCKDILADLGQYQEWFNEQCARFTIPCIDVLFQLVYYLDPEFAKGYFPEFFHGGEDSIPRFEDLGPKELLFTLAQATEGMRTLMREQRRAGMLIQQQQRKLVVATLGDDLADESWRKKTANFFVTDDPVYLFGQELMSEFDIKQEKKLRQKALYFKPRANITKFEKGKQPQTAGEQNGVTHKPIPRQAQRHFTPQSKSTFNSKYASGDKPSSASNSESKN